ncbi:MAG: hypothetical protein KGZ51_08030 [Erysipelothrix sp.]|jgi:hypothetical protein|nr:hypothetical protein [Erysipelothrix sp.]
MNKIVLKGLNKRKGLRHWLLLCLCSLMLLLSACTPQANLPDDDKPKPNPDDPGLIDDNPNDPGEVDPNPTGKLVFTADVIKNLGNTKVSYKAFDTFKHYAPVTLTPIDFSKIQWMVDFYRKDYKSLDAIFADYPNLKATKKTVEDADVYTFDDGTRLEVLQHWIRFISDYFSFSVSDKRASFHTSIAQTPPYEIIVVEDQMILLNDQQKVVKYYYTGNNVFGGWKYGDFIGNNSNQLALHNLYSGNVSLFTINEQGLTPISFINQIDELDALSNAVLDGYKFDVHFNEQKTSSIENITQVFSSTLPTKLLRSEYPKEESYYSANPLRKDIYTVIDPITSKVMIKVRWFITNSLDPQIHLAQAVYEFTDPSDLTKLKIKDVNLRYSDSITNNIAVKSDDLIVYDGNQIYVDTRSTPQDIVKTINSKITLEADLQETLVIESETKKGLTLTYKVFDAFTDSHIYKITNPRFSFNQKYKLGLTQDDILALLGIPDLEGNDGVNFESWTNDQRWSYFVAYPLTDEIYVSYYYIYKLVFYFKDGKVSEIQLISFHTSV